MAHPALAAPLRACYGLIMGSKCFPLGVLETKLSAPLCDSWEDEWHMMTWNKLLIHTQVVGKSSKYTLTSYG